MPFLKAKCGVCSKVAETEKTIQLGDTVICKLTCGHFLAKANLVTKKSPDTVVSIDGKKLMPFQCQGVKKFEESGGRALCGDEQGLGKTVQVLATLTLHPEMLPALFILKSSLKVQWQHEILRWMGEDSFTQVIEDARTPMLPGLIGYIISYDLIRRFDMNNDPNKKPKKGIKLSLVDMMKRCGIKTIVLDECQQIKNQDSTRTQVVRILCNEVKHILATSGTPIKNNATEFFPILNILRPERYPSFKQFIMHDCNSYFNGFSWKSAGLRDPERFREKNKDFIFRRTREEVMPELPRITRNFQFSELGEAVEAAYLDTFRSFREDYNSISGQVSFSDQANILQKIGVLRHLTGLSKIDPCVDQIMEFLGSTDRKIAIFVHHQDVHQILKTKLDSLLAELELGPTISLTSDLNSIQRQEVVDKFREDPKVRVAILSTLSAGEGLNMQFCHDAVMLERQWNPANEEQAEGRFIRIGQLSDKVTMTYHVAVGTIDEFFSELVEKKREWVTSSLDGSAIEWDQTSLMKELAEVLAVKGGKRWNL